MRMFLVTVAFIVIFPGVTFAQFAPQSQAEFEQRFTGWTLQFDAPDCNEGNGFDPVTFIAPGRFDTAGFQGAYEYQGTGANTGTLTLTPDILSLTLALDLMFNSRTLGTFTTSLGGACEGNFEFVDPTTDTTPPLLVSAVVDNSGDTIGLTFSEYIDSSSLPFPLSFAITVTANDEPVHFHGSRATGATITLRELTLLITPGQSAVVSYTDPTPGDDEKAIQDVAGNDVASFTVTATNNSTTTDTTPPSLVSVVVEDTGNQITLTFDEDVHVTRNPADGFDDSPFSITADGQTVSRTVRATIRDVIFFSGLSPVITSGQTVTVSYVDPTPGDDEHGLHDRAGNDAASFTRTAVNNSTVESVQDAGPTFGTAVVPSLTYTVGVRISPRVLPAATGGRGPLTYALTPALPAGLTFTAATRTLAGTPAAVQAATTYTLTAADANGDSTTLTFRLTVESAGGPGGPGPWAFTDPMLMAGETPIRAVHFTELREAVNAFRFQCGLAPTAWTDPVLSPGVTPVKAVHLTELRTGLTAAYRACGLTPTPTFTGVVRAGMPIRALHVTELRTAVNGVRRNRAPQPSGAIPRQTLAVGGDAGSVDVARYFSDPDGDVLTYRASSNRLGVVMSSVAGSTVTVTPVGAGTATVTVTAHDHAGLFATQTIAVTVRDTSSGWQRTGSGSAILDLPTSITRIRIEGEYSGYLENFVVWCGIEGDFGGLLVNEILGTAPGYSTRYSGVHSALREYYTRGEPCRQLQIEYSSGVRWQITDVSGRSSLSPLAGTGSLAGDQAAVKRALGLRHGR